ncbi:methyltransferase domain-containing protein [Paenibacillus riograndensis]|uniref:Methyltransferase domain-containing protein n=1 Tax=Paenibacillus riograndensis SBR5 TaxID=1073571 RepID=A0A0E4HFP4_9BACL|nr:methyltransferase domain-containing protein [Paenibacillus riograndensis]CQR58546.1 hypothetical protein PRIO_6199 [Paenibacillus riograndensis SBR5]
MEDKFLVNSKEYWDSRFETNWDSYSGREQTLYFGGIAIEMLPDWFKNVLSEGVTFADVGCAEGDCTNFFSELFPNTKFTGIDFSESAIRKAKEYYPEQTFIQADIKSIDKKFDVVFSSNTLEHFINPFDIIRELFRISSQYTVILIPFQEYERFREHFHTFDYKDFNVEYNDFTIVYAQEYDCSIKENIFWAGKQLLVIYERNQENQKRKKDVTLKDYINSLTYNYSDLKKQLDAIQLENTSLKEKNERIEITLNHLIETNKEQLALIHANIINTDKLNDERIRYIEQVNSLENELNTSISQKLAYEERLDFFDKQEKWLIAEKYRLDTEVNEIKSSNIYKLSRKYYKIRDNIPIIKHAYKGLRIWKRHGFYALCRQIKHKITKPTSQNKENKNIDTLYSHINEKYQENKINGFFIIPSAFEFDELYNQRTINLAKYSSKDNKAVLFVVWQWNKNEIIPDAFKEVYPNVFQIPLFEFIENIEKLQLLNEIGNKKAILNIPSEQWNTALYRIKELGYSTIYDIMDDWEEFNKVGQAAWYNKQLEEEMIINVESVVAVSPPLSAKFSFLRRDIICIGNGYYKDLLGENNKYISGKKNSSNKITLGYFGHLTESWFDWGLVEEMLKDEKIFVEIIGYGAKEATISSLKKYSNFKYIGKVEPKNLYKYIQNWDIGMIPFKKSKLSEAVDPIKIYEYIYFGLKVIVTGIPHLELFPNTLLYSDEIPIVDFIYKVYKDPKEDNDLVVETFLNESSWDQRFKKMMEYKNIYNTEIYHYETAKNS